MKNGFLQKLLCDSTSCRDSWQEAKSHGQSLQKVISQAQQSQQEARDREQSPQKPNITDSLCRKRKLVDSFIPREEAKVAVLPTLGVHSFTNTVYKRYFGSGLFTAISALN